MTCYKCKHLEKVPDESEGVLYFCVARDMMMGRVPFYETEGEFKHRNIATFNGTKCVYEPRIVQKSLEAYL